MDIRNVVGSKFLEVWDFGHFFIIESIHLCIPDSLSFSIFFHSDYFSNTPEGCILEYLENDKIAC